MLVDSEIHSKWNCKKYSVPPRCNLNVILDDRLRTYCKVWLRYGVFYEQVAMAKRGAKYTVVLDDAENGQKIAYRQVEHWIK